MLELRVMLAVAFKLRSMGFQLTQVVVQQVSPKLSGH